MTVSKHYVTLGNKCDRVEQATHSVYRIAKLCHISFDKFQELKTTRIHDNADRKGLTNYYLGYLHGVDCSLFKRLQQEWVEWKMYYTNKVGRVVYVKKWEHLPLYIRNNGNFNGNFFWNGTTKPFGNNPSTGNGMK